LIFFSPHKKVKKKPEKEIKNVLYGFLEGLLAYRKTKQSPIVDFLEPSTKQTFYNSKNYITRTHT
jgi:hypothetical protein